MSAQHNWIIDAERYRILLSLHRSLSHFNLFHPHTLFLTHSSLQTQMSLLDLVQFLGFFPCFVSILVVCKVYITYSTTCFISYITRRHFILNCSLIKYCTQLLFGKAGITEQHTILQSWHIQEDIPLQFSGKAICVKAFSFKENMVTTLKEITKLETGRSNSY